MSEAQTQVMSEAQKGVMSEAQTQVMSEAQIKILKGSASEEDLVAITVACLQLSTRPNTKEPIKPQQVSHWKRTAAYESIRSDAFVKQNSTGRLWQN